MPVTECRKYWTGNVIPNVDDTFFDWPTLSLNRKLNSKFGLRTNSQTRDKEEFMEIY